MAFSQFTKATLSGGVVRVSGPLTANPKEGKVKILSFLIAQGNTIVEGAGTASGTSWVGRAEATGLKVGNAHGFGVAVLVTTEKGKVPAFRALTWNEQIKLERLK